MLAIPDRELPNQLRRRKTIGFSLDPENGLYIDNFIIEKGQFINKAINFYIKFIQDPKVVLKELKKRNPELYKLVNREQ
jgi:hypothetical protein